MAKRINVSRRLKLWRKRRSKELGRDLSQVDAAAEIGLKPSTYIQYEQGRRGSKMNDVTYDRIIAVTAHNGASAPPVAAESQAVAQV